MAYPRHLDVPPGAHGVYHCVSRCVRRAFLCGHDPATGRCFDHRRDWLEARIVHLAQLFAVAVHAYAVMSNHFHLVVELDPRAALEWSDEDVARRWLAIGALESPPDDARVHALAAHGARIDTLRERLASLSWFMRFLKEPIARRANAEDECTGRFWEGRFRAQALLDDAALLACMTYVDLNPVRAGIATTPHDAEHTSVRRRARAAPDDRAHLPPVSASFDSRLVPATTAQYLALVDWTARRLHPSPDRADTTSDPPVLGRLGLRTRQWLVQVPATESRYWRAIGHVEALVERARNSGRRWLRGLGTARRVQHGLDPG